MNHIKFRDRADAGQQLAQRLLHLKDQHPVVLALPRGGVPVGFEIARALHAPMDLILVRKIGVPWQPELAAAAVVDGGEPQVVENTDVISALGLGKDFIKRAVAKQLEEIERRRELYLGGRKRVDLDGRTAIVVDDGIATGATTHAALKAVRRSKPAWLVLAVAVAPPDAITALRPEADDVICLGMPAGFGAISLYYVDFRQVDDAEVVELLKLAAGFTAEPALPGES